MKNKVQVIDRTSISSFRQIQKINREVYCLSMWNVYDWMYLLDIYC